MQSTKITVLLILSLATILIESVPVPQDQSEVQPPLTPEEKMKEESVRTEPQDAGLKDITAAVVPSDTVSETVEDVAFGLRDDGGDEEEDGQIEEGVGRSPTEEAQKEIDENEIEEAEVMEHEGGDNENKVEDEEILAVNSDPEEQLHEILGEARPSLSDDEEEASNDDDDTIEDKKETGIIEILPIEENKPDLPDKENSLERSERSPQSFQGDLNTGSDNKGAEEKEIKEVPESTEEIKGLEEQELERQEQEQGEEEEVKHENDLEHIVDGGFEEGGLKMSPSDTNEDQKDVETNE